ncbi:MAG: PAS domain S-box protein [Ignavibacteria bacterium]|nr:PAS domain S-box protein [Ignavibacteria bacterium]MBI3764994.1 PAS domain S-box protein [Ignavibacteriales bacterium]
MLSLTNKVAHGEGDNFEAVRKRKDNTLLDVSFLGAPFHVDGEESAVYGIYRDITQRKRAEQTLASERLMVRTVIENLPDQIYAKDTESRFLLCNKAVALNAGATSEQDLIGKTDFDLFPRELAEQYFADEQAIMKLGKPLIGREEPIVDKRTGELHMNLTTKVPVKDSTGKVFGLVGMNRDITERKQAERDLEVQKAYFEELFESAPEAVVVLDQEDRIVRANSTFTRIFGFTRDEAVGKLINELIAPGDLNKEFISLTNKITRGETINFEGVRQRKDGKRINVSVLGAAIHVGGGRLGVYAIYRDITEHVEAEKAREKLIVDLQEAHAKALTGLFSICAWCKKVRDDKGYWNQFEAYLSEHSEAKVTHGICPECMLKVLKEFTGK